MGGDALSAGCKPFGDKGSADQYLERMLDDYRQRNGAYQPLPTIYPWVVHEKAPKTSHWRGLIPFPGPGTLKLLVFRIFLRAAPGGEEGQPRLPHCHTQWLRFLKSSSPCTGFTVPWASTSNPEACRAFHLRMGMHTFGPIRRESFNRCGGRQ